MAPLLESSAALGALLIAVYVVYALLSQRSRRVRLPPGPAGWPIVGNMFDVPKSGAEWIDYRNMGEKYDSDIIYLDVFGTRIVVLNSFEAITELLEKRARIYSSRPRFVMVQELMGCEFDPQGKESIWNHPHQIHGVHETLHRLLESPDQWKSHFRHQAGATILEIAYGVRAKTDEDPHIAAAEMTARYAADGATPGKYLVDTLPWLKYVPAWIPGASFQAVAQEAKKVIAASLSIPFEAVKAEMAQGIANPSFTARCLEKVDQDGDIPYQESVIKDVAGVMFSAFPSQTALTFSSFMLAMVKYPEVQAKAQRELDTILGPNNLPVFADKEDLPYLSALVKECLRWEVLFPFSLPHLSTSDDVYNGYHIPAGTMVLPNTWAVLRDESVYPEAGNFNPDRYLTKEGNLDPSVRDPEAAFGYGRRICPGRHMARESIWLTVGSILACFKIENSVDVHGNVIEPSGKYLSGLLRQPEPFSCSIKPRSKEIVNIIRGL
ncbi:hypothetical protein HWV62_40100 [Athelia sp. TMB]|nr:hypothetical protein HWV62_40100 [Athelia sp. TMB]